MVTLIVGHFLHSSRHVQLLNFIAIMWNEDSFKGICLGWMFMTWFIDWFTGWSRLDPCSCNVIDPVYGTRQMTPAMWLQLYWYQIWQSN